jgi:hypothetical protein
MIIYSTTYVVVWVGESRKSIIVDMRFDSFDHIDEQTVTVTNKFFKYTSCL